MKKRFLEDCLAKGMSLEAIGREVGKHPSTVGYWLKKYGLKAVHAERYAARGAPTRAQLEPLVAEGLRLVDIAARLDRSIRTVAYWLDKHELRTDPGRRRALVAEARRNGERQLILKCRRHGEAVHILEGRDGRPRCSRCRSRNVSEWRRRTKLLLISEAGSCCAICGYARCPAALEFHHLDPSKKSFSLSMRGVTRSLEKPGPGRRSAFSFAPTATPKWRRGSKVAKRPGRSWLSAVNQPD
jgi:transposase